MTDRKISKKYPTKTLAVPRVFACLDIGFVDMYRKYDVRTNSCSQRITDITPQHTRFTTSNFTGLESISISNQKGNKPMRRVILESPYGSTDPTHNEQNVAYARRAVRDSSSRGEAPIASHLLYTQFGILNDGLRAPARRGHAGYQDLAARRWFSGFRPGPDRRPPWPGFLPVSWFILIL
jgi:hypothetical protein